MTGLPDGSAVLDSRGDVWIVTRDGGMVIRPDEASETNVESAGIRWLEQHRGPLVVLHDARKARR